MPIPGVGPGYSVHFPPMSESDDRPGCRHHIHVASSHGPPEPSLVCSCSVGLIHMHDCPVMNGRTCAAFDASPEADEVLDAHAFDEVHTRLMVDFLSRPYTHRVRELMPGGDPWMRRREDRLADLAAASEPDEELSPEAEERYEAEKERLIEQRKRREQARLEREEKTREERARERAKMGIKTVVERAQESVAARGNVADSIVDEMPSPNPAKKKRRRRRKKPADGAKPEGGPRPEPGAAKPAEGGATGDAAKPKRRRRRRRRRKPSEGGGD